MRYLCCIIAGSLLLTAGCGRDEPVAVEEPVKEEESQSTWTELDWQKERRIAEEELAARPKKPTFEPTVQEGMPLLPYLVDLNTTPEDLSYHALVVARQEAASGLISTEGMAERQFAIMEFWAPQLIQKQIALQYAYDERAAWDALNTEEARLVTESARKLAEVDAKYERLMWEQQWDLPLLIGPRTDAWLRTRSVR